MFLGEKPEHFIKFFSASLKKVNPFFEVTASFASSFTELYKKYKEYEKELEENLKSNEENLSDYFGAFWDLKGNLFENDFITQTINEVLRSLKQKDKENVLIIDDIDRIDPEHIFRILNILSVHNNHFCQENKFLFDKVILVCDISNIKKIFEHRYGTGVDFDGYIDKFYSTDVFHFNSYDALRQYVYYTPCFDKFSEYDKYFLVFFLTNSIAQKQLVFRNIVKAGYDYSIPEKKYITHQLPIEEYHSLSWNLHNSHIDFSKEIYVDQSDLSFLKVVKVLAMIYGGFDKLIKSTENMTEEDDHLMLNADANHLISLVIPKLLFTQYGIESFAKLGYNRANEIVEIGYPEIELAGTTFRIFLDWNKNNRYNGERSFFSNAKIYTTSEQDARVRFSTKLILKEFLTLLQTGFDYYSFNNISLTRPE